MKTLLLILIQIVLLSIFVHSQAQILNENGACVNSASHMLGVCRKKQDCPGATVARACSFRADQEIVCCDRPQPMTADPTNHTIRPRRPIGQVAREMCKAYSLVLNVRRSSGLFLDDDVMNEGDAEDTPLCSLAAQALVIGGTETEPKEFPHMVNLGYNETNSRGELTIAWSCGGALISKRHVLTAGHCVYASRSRTHVSWARLGDLDMSTDEDDAQPVTMRIARRTYHPLYKRPARYNDIALLELEHDVLFNEYVRPACINVDLELPVGLSTTATGWGVTTTAGDVSPILMKVEFPIVSVSHCNSTFAPEAGTKKLQRGIENDSMLCAGLPGKDTCQGDSGGPLQVLLQDPFCMYSVVGVTSFGSRRCGVQSNASVGVYTRVTKYVSWIEDVVWPEE